MSSNLYIITAPSGAGKTTLIRSLKTTNHAVAALRRYGAAYAALEKELQDLLKGPSLKTRIQLSAENTHTKYKTNGNTHIT